MAKRRKQKSSAQEIREEILRHLSENPPPAGKSQPKAPTKRSTRSKPPPVAKPSRPRLMLRKMPLELALARLESFLHAKRALGTEELIVIVGKGRSSPDGIPILAPAVRQWLGEHPQLVAGFEDAPSHEGGTGALLVRLRPRA